MESARPSKARFDHAVRREDPFRPLWGAVLLPLWGPVPWLSLVALVASLAGCNEPGTSSAGAESATTSAPTPSASVAAAPSSQLSSQQGGGQKQKRERPLSLVYLDGKVVGVLKIGEIPPDFEPTMVNRPKPMPLFNMARYLERVGAKLASIKAIQLVGAGRTSYIQGEELRRVKDDLHFKFSRGFKGPPAMDWPKQRVNSTTKIDRIIAINVFQEKEAPTFDPVTKTFHWSDGSEVEGVPHAEGPAPRGPRVYLDGKLLGTLDRLRGKRDEESGGGRQGGDGSGQGQGQGKGRGEPKGEDEPKGEGKGSGEGEGNDPRKPAHELAAILAESGVPLDKIKAIDFVSRDDIFVGRLDAAAWKEVGAKLSFKLSRRGQDMRFDMPSQATPEPSLVDVSALVAYVTIDPPKRDIKAPKQQVDPAEDE